MTKQLEAHIAELQKVLDGSNGKYWAHGPAFKALIAALEQAQKQRESWKQIAQKSISERENDIAALDAARRRIAELESCGRIDYTRRLERECAELKASPLAVKLPAADFKKLATEIVDNLIDVGGADGSSIQQYLEWTEKTCRAAFGTVEGE